MRTMRTMRQKSPSWKVYFQKIDESFKITVDRYRFTLFLIFELTLQMKFFAHIQTYI